MNQKSTKEILKLFFKLLQKMKLITGQLHKLNAWYVWCLYCNNKKDEAYKIYEANVSGKPLEGIELYWMGKFMKGLGKGFNAIEFFKAAQKNKYDLSPSIINDLDKYLKE